MALCPRCGRTKYKPTAFYCGVCLVELKRIGLQVQPKGAAYPTAARTQDAWKGYRR